ncbi:MAG TPA: GNAT family N-acetyltransferase [Isosphaeraceae bacterium]|nr:GNAT family N-acetyltransferase [Isosphaeraceae bacterium]
MGVLYQRVPKALRQRLIADVLGEVREGLLDLSGLWVAWRRGRIIGTVLTQALAGRAAAVWAPEVTLVWGRSATAIALVHAALDSLRVQGFRVAQALLDESAPPHGADDLTRGGLPQVTELLYLERATAPPFAVEPGLPRFDWRAYGPATEVEFRQVLQATYTGSLDMPELEGVRSLDDVLASHRAGGRFDPVRWQIGLLSDDQATAAILLLSELPEHEAWEVAYLGLTPAARGRGLGRVALAHALNLARPHTARLELAVDARNEPANHLYQRAGFTLFDRRAVHLAALSKGCTEQ